MFGNQENLKKGRDTSRLPSGGLDANLTTDDRDRQHSNVDEANEGSLAAEDFINKNAAKDPESVLDHADPIIKS